ncbi:hypothetical protein LCGC14_0441890 [marine sediment metagenome]|uniref:Uncharacterized protein n=1 Tax=marine sediment metagenome TaxID=412755 RepID=A0A0F9SK24_9ZZZZ
METSKIIQKEKERQEELLKEIEFFQEPPAVHKQSLINLKEYLEKVCSEIQQACDFVKFGVKFEVELKEDIKELELMIGRYI